MASNNLRIIYRNLIDYTGTSITASSTLGNNSVTYLKYDYKSLKYRSVASTTTTVRTALVVTAATATAIGGIILGFSNLSSAATIRVRGFTGTAPTLSTVTDANVASTVTTTGATQQYDTGTVSAAPFQGQGDWNWGVQPTATNAFYNKNVYGRVWLSTVNQALACTSWVIEITDTASTAGQTIDIGRLIMGPYWAPKYNTSYGVTTNITDMSTSERSEAGDLITFEAPYFKSLSLELKYMEKDDRDKLLELYRLLGTRRPMFISIFPDNTDDWGKEGAYQLFGKFSTITGLTHSMFSIYASNLDIEEV